MINKNFEELVTCWSDYGITKPYWSVLTHPEYISPDDVAIKSFYDSGITSIATTNNIFEKYNLPSVENKIVLDFGTGLGRLSHGLLHFGAKEIFALDISSNHLKIAEKNFNTDKIKWVHLNEMKPISDFIGKKVDVIISYLVLQHNRPDVCKQYVSWLLEVLEVNGVALLHIPYHIPKEIMHNYEGNTSVMEIHHVPKEEIGEIISINNCRLVGVEETRFCGSNEINDCLYIIEKIA